MTRITITKIYCDGCEKEMTPSEFKKYGVCLGIYDFCSYECYHEWEQKQDKQDEELRKDLK